MDDPGHRWHDLGGRPAGRCEPDEHEYETWEKRVDALMVLLSYRCKAMTVDELRRYIEELGPAAYDDLGYYERWMHSLTQAMLQRGMISVDELAAKMAELERRGHE
jgi:methylphosphotriester-DNA--protein-cysteine methyltransferase